MNREVGGRDVYQKFYSSEGARRRGVNHAGVGVIPAASVEACACSTQIFNKTCFGNAINMHYAKTPCSSLPNSLRRMSIPKRDFRRFNGVLFASAVLG